jgi:hypothetical protein
MFMGDLGEWNGGIVEEWEGAGGKRDSPQRAQRAAEIGGSCSVVLCVLCGEKGCWIGVFHGVEKFFHSVDNFFHAVEKMRKSFPWRGKLLYYGTDPFGAGMVEWWKSGRGPMGREIHHRGH